MATKRSIEEITASITAKRKTPDDADLTENKQKTMTDDSSEAEEKPEVKKQKKNECVVFHAATFKFEDVHLGKKTNPPKGQSIVPLTQGPGNDNPLIIQFDRTGGYIAKFPITKSVHGKRKLTYTLGVTDDTEYDNVHAFQNAVKEYAVKHKAEWFPPEVGQEPMEDSCIRQNFKGFLIKQKPVKFEKEKVDDKKVPIVGSDGKLERWSGNMSTVLPYNKFTDEMQSSSKIVNSMGIAIPVESLPGKKYSRISVQAPHIWFMQTGIWGILSTVKNVELAHDPYEAAGRPVDFV